MKHKSFLAGMITMLLIFALTGTAIATTGKVQKEIEYRDIKVSLDGKVLDLRDAKGNAVEPFMFGGTNYIPARALAEALGLNVAWDSANATVVLTTPKTTTPATPVTPVTPPVVKDDPTPAKSSYSRTNPAPIGTPQQVTVTNSTWSYIATVEITNVFRGQAAWAAIREANSFNEAPTDSREYVLATVKVTIDSVSTDRAVSVKESNFKAFSGTNAEYEREATVEPSPQLNGDLYEGASTEGFVSFVVNTDDPAPKVVYGAAYDGTGGAWFSLSK